MNTHKGNLIIEELPRSITQEAEFSQISTATEKQEGNHEMVNQNVKN